MINTYLWTCEDTIIEYERLSRTWPAIIPAVLRITIVAVGEA
jgi:hypothetical protein